MLFGQSLVHKLRYLRCNTVPRQRSMFPPTPRCGMFEYGFDPFDARTASNTHMYRSVTYVHTERASDVVFREGWTVRERDKTQGTEPRIGVTMLSSAQSIALSSPLLLLLSRASHSIRTMGRMTVGPRTKLLYLIWDDFSCNSMIDGSDDVPDSGLVRVRLTQTHSTYRSTRCEGVNFSHVAPQQGNGNTVGCGTLFFFFFCNVWLAIMRRISFLTTPCRMKGQLH